MFGGLYFSQGWRHFHFCDHERTPCSTGDHLTGHPESAKVPDPSGRWSNVGQVLLDTSEEVGSVALLASDKSDDLVLAAMRAIGAVVTRHDGIESLLAVDLEDATAAIVITTERIDPRLVELVAAASRHESAAPVVVVCDDVGGGAARPLLAAGAAGLVLRGEAAQTLAPSLRAVIAGQVCVPRPCARQVERPVLSIRERQVISLVVMGFMNSEIAERLFLAESTIKSHLSSTFAKLGVHSRHEAVDLIVNPMTGAGLGILSLGVEPLQGSRREAAEETAVLNGQ
jgi:DNA-binding NarL/FixJ family response regulator